MRSAILDFDGLKYTLYENGDIYSHKGTKLKPRKNKDGYLVVTVGAKYKRRGKTLHRLVAEAFIDNPDNLPEVDHIDNDRANPNVKNLRWVSHLDNSRRITSHHHHGTSNPRARLTAEDVVNIRKAYRDGMRQNAIAKQYGIGTTTVCDIVARRTWKYQY